MAKTEAAGWELFYREVRRIPRGRVSTYGEIARLAGRPRAARQVGYALAALKDAETRVPWQRVLGKRGAFAVISLADGAAARQRTLLEREGVRFDDAGRVPLALFGWPEAGSASSRYERRSEKSGTSRGRRTHQLKTTESRMGPGGRSRGRSGT